MRLPRCPHSQTTSLREPSARGRRTHPTRRRRRRSRHLHHCDVRNLAATALRPVRQIRARTASDRRHPAGGRVHGRRTNHRGDDGNGPESGCGHPCRERDYRPSGPIARLRRRDFASGPGRRLVLSDDQPLDLPRSPAFASILPRRRRLACPLSASLAPPGSVASPLFASASLPCIRHPRACASFCPRDVAR